MLAGRCGPCTVRSNRCSFAALNPGPPGWVRGSLYEKLTLSLLPRAFSSRLSGTAEADHHEVNVVISGTSLTIST